MRHKSESDKNRIRHTLFSRKSVCIYILYKLCPILFCSDWSPLVVEEKRKNFTFIMLCHKKNWNGCSQLPYMKICCWCQKKFIFRIFEIYTTHLYITKHRIIAFLHTLGLNHEYKVKFWAIFKAYRTITTKKPNEFLGIVARKCMFFCIDFFLPFIIKEGRRCQCQMIIKRVMWCRYFT